MRFDTSPNYAGEYDDIDYLLVRGEIAPRVQEALSKFEETSRHGAWSLLVRR
jgi:hypothetical protein